MIHDKLPSFNYILNKPHQSGPLVGEDSDCAGPSKVRITSLELWPHDSG